MKATVLFIVLTSLAVIGSAQEQLMYHTIRTDKAGNIIPWYDDDPAKSYDHILHLIWNFWDTMRVDMNGIPYYMNHQVWRPDFNDPRGLGGDQLQMALSSWQLLYRYSGNERIKENMKFLCDYYLSHGLSSASAQWPNIPFPYNTLIYSGQYDGDMVIGKDYTQPDKAGSFGIQLIYMYKMMSNERYPHATERRYLEAAIQIANTLAKQVKAGDQNNSPLPFKVNAYTGEIGKLKSNTGDKSDAGLSAYTTNWSGTAELFLELIALKQGNVEVYEKALTTIIAWMKTYPMKINKWGPFFEDIPGWSDTQINAMTWARFMMNHRNYFPEWKTDVQRIVDWVYKTLGNDEWKKYGVTVINEQTVYLTPGNSHTSRQAADELLFASLTGDTEKVSHAVRQLNWATYMVDEDGKNRYPRDENWLTDGYGDYVRHYLRAMEALPGLAPGNSDHLISSTSVIQHVAYHGALNKSLSPVARNIDLDQVRLYYRTFDTSGTETIRLIRKPTGVFLDDAALTESNDQTKAGFSWSPLDIGGVLTVKRVSGNSVLITGTP
ncbi:MAG: hypothetical protein OEV74_05270 [Cyclobacteriaceae bacterium]|nr:hypothetical protein [Cyclobacteriaceae bacterium]MDH4295670.1 hypothetical protein [Cyclobacteriaceae bacterium]MDH5249982.1 hypothetical protein [Cyclobacteriaceae bacterium]